jgi:peptide/nickel transport system substrate-binding protein
MPHTRLMSPRLIVTALLAAGVMAAAVAEPVRWARGSDPATLDPHAVNTGTNFAVLHQLYEPLVVRNDQSKLEGALAESWKLTSDPTVWEFKLRKGVKFHDGTPFTADDVVFSLNRAKLPSSQLKSLLATMAEVKKVDDFTVQVKTNGPNLIFPDNLTNLFIMSEKWAKANKADVPQDVTAKGENFSTRNANGTGPFTLATREVDVKTVMKQNPNYWGKGKSPMQVTELTYLPIKAPATRVAALLSGEVDLLQDVPAQDVERLKKDSKLRVTDGPENRSIFLGLNLGAKELKYSDVKGKNPLADPRVREAINLAIDRDAIKRAVMRGQSIPSGIIAPAFVNGYDKAFAAYAKPDVAKAKKLLADAGYPNGFGITLHAPNDRYVNDEAIATAVAGFLGRIGIKTTVNARPIAIHSSAIQSADTDFYLFGWGVPTYDSAYIFDYLVYSRGKDGRGPTNATGYSNEAVDKLIAQLASEADKAKRNQAIHSIWTAVQQDRPYVALHDQVLSYAQHPKLNVKPNPENTVFFKNVTIGKK